MLRISVYFGQSSHSFMGALELAQLGFRKSDQEEAPAWILAVADVSAATSRFDATNGTLAKFFPFPLLGLRPGENTHLDLPWRLEMCAGNTALVEVMDGDRLLFRQIWLAEARDLPRFADELHPQ